jgi:hypothetical protein
MATTDSRDLSFDRASLGAGHAHLTPKKPRETYLQTVQPADPVSDPIPNPPIFPQATAPEILPLVELYPACFDWERPKPLRINIHKQLIRAGHDRATVLRSLKAYCTAPRYRASLQAGAARIDLCGQPAGVVTDKEAAHARQEPTPRAAERTAARESLPPDDTPIPKENLVPGRLELTAKFSELPRPLPVQGGLKIGVQTGEGIVTAILPAKVWRKLEQAARDYPQWVAALSGSLERFADGEIALKHPALQIFEKKARPEAAAEGKGPEPNGPAVEAPDAKAPDSNGPTVKAPELKAPESKAPEVNASAVKKPEGKASDPKAPNSKAPDPKAPAVKASVVKVPAPKAPDGQAAKPPSTAETPKGAAAPHAARPSPTHIRATISLKGRASPQKE